MGDEQAGHPGIAYVKNALESGFGEMFDGPEGPVRAEAFTKGLAAFKVTNKGIEIRYADGRWVRFWKRRRAVNEGDVPDDVDPQMLRDLG